MNTLQNLQSKNLKSMLIADFISSFGSIFLSMCVLLKIYQDTSSILLASMIPFFTILGKTIVLPTISNLRINFSFRTIFFTGELFASFLVVGLIIIKNVYLTLLIYILYQTMFFLLRF